MNVFHSNLRRVERKLRNTKMLNTILRTFTFGIFDLNNKLVELQKEFNERQKELKNHLLITKEHETFKEYLKDCKIDGTSISRVGPQGSLTTGSLDYGADWEDIAKRIKMRDAYLCQEADGKCRGPLQVHHILSLSKGGTNDEDNLITLCEYHHRLKHPHMEQRSNKWKYTVRY